jgi:hypothetical protein
MSSKPTRAPRRQHLRRSAAKVPIPRRPSVEDASGENAQSTLSEAARNHAEQLRRVAEAARELRDQHRTSAEATRQGQELLRESAEVVRTATEQARLAAEDARRVAVASVAATAENLKVALDQMTLVEELRRALRDIRDTNKLDRN